MSVVIDASALLAVLLEEDGSDFVLAALRESRLSTVSLSECMSRVVDRGHHADSVAAIVRRFEIEISPFSATQARMAADLRPATRHIGLSLGDRACLALALESEWAIFTGDRRLASLDIGVDIRLIR